jgi:hypothetical protein
MDWQEHAAIMEYDGSLPRQEAEARTLQDTIAHRKKSERASSWKDVCGLTALASCRVF